MIVLDTTILCLATGEPDRLREPCRRLLHAQQDGRVELATTVEVLQEFAHVRARRRPRGDAIALARLFSEALTVLETSVDDLDHGLDLFREHPGVDAFDAVLAAVAIRRGAEALVSADRGFAGIAGLRHVDPGAPELDQLLGGRG